MKFHSFQGRRAGIRKLSLSMGLSLLALSCVSTSNQHSTSDRFDSSRFPAGLTLKPTASVTKDLIAATTVGPDKKFVGVISGSGDLSVPFLDVDSFIKGCGADEKSVGDGTDPELARVNLSSVEDLYNVKTNHESGNEIQTVNQRGLGWLSQQIDELAAITPEKSKNKNKAVKKPKLCKLDKDLGVALNEMKNLIAILTDNSVETEVRAKARQHLAVIAESVSNNFRFPIPKKVELLVAPVVFTDRVTNFVGDGTGGPSKNISKDATAAGDPESSTLWKRQKDISKREMYYGFGRNKMAINTNDICEYKGPKSGFGIHGGFDVKCGDDEFKVRFGSEAHGSSFNTRIFSALGYNVPIFDHVDGIKVRFDAEKMLKGEDMFNQYNSRADVAFDITAVGFKVARINIQEFIDPMEAVQSVVLKDGKVLTRKEFENFYYRDRGIDIAAKLPYATNVNFEFGKTIDYVVLTKAGVSPKSKKEVQVGGWDWNNLDYADRREFRAAGLIAAWIGWYDARWDNNKLILDPVKDGGSGYKLKHMITDLGSGLGNTFDFLSYTNGDANGFSWRLAEENIRTARDGGPQGPYPNASLFRNYVVIDNNKPFKNFDTEDAKWMARQIGQLTEEQILHALLATNKSAAEVKMFLEKLLYRRDKIMKVYGLEKEVGLLRPKMSPDSFLTLDFDPEKDPQFKAGFVVAGGAKTVNLPTRDYVIYRGVVCKREFAIGAKCTTPKPANE